MDFLRVQGLGRVIRFPGLEDAPQLRVLRRDGRRQFDHRFVGHRRIFLRQVADGNAALGGDLPGVGRFLAQDDREERGLARPVRADEPDAVLAVDLQGGVGEQHSFAVGLADAGQS